MKAVDPRSYYHPQDRTALNTLKSIPGFNTLFKVFMKNFSENLMRQEAIASNVRLGPNQLPEIYNLLPPICETLGIAEPELYLALNPWPNAYTYGDTKTFITLTSGLLESCSENELKVVIAHECGHIACHHSLYHTMGNFILAGSDAFFSKTFITLPLKIAFSYWERCSELSCDRAAAIYMQGYEDVVDVMMRLSGAGKQIVQKLNMENYLKQAEEYKQFVNKNSWNKLMQYLLVLDKDHPFAVVRASEIRRWCRGYDFQRIISRINGIEKKAATGRIAMERTAIIKKCPNCGKPIESGWRFCKHCGKNM